MWLILSFPSLVIVITKSRTHELSLWPSLRLHIGACVCTPVYVHACVHAHRSACVCARQWFTVSDVARASPFKPPVPVPYRLAVDKAIHSILPTPASRETWVPRAPLPLLQQGNTGEGGPRLCAWCTGPAAPATRDAPGHWLRQLQQIFGRKGPRFSPQLISASVATANGADNCRGLAHAGNLIPSLLVICLANCPPWAPNLCSVSSGWWGRQAVGRRAGTARVVPRPSLPPSERRGLLAPEPVLVPSGEKGGPGAAGLQELSGGRHQP